MTYEYATVMIRFWGCLETFKQDDTVFVWMIAQFIFLYYFILSHILFLKLEKIWVLKEIPVSCTIACFLLSKWCIPFQWLSAKNKRSVFPLCYLNTKTIKTFYRMTLQINFQLKHYITFWATRRLYIRQNVFSSPGMI